MNTFNIHIAQIIISLSGISTFQTGHLNNEVESVTEKELQNGIMWELSLSGEKSDTDNRVFLHGDTLYSETVDGARRWYQLENDTLFFIREETLTEAMNLIPPVPSAILGDERYMGEQVYKSSGSNSTSVKIDRVGTYESVPSRRGILTINNRDTVNATLTIERMIYHELYLTPSHGESGTTLTAQDDPESPMGTTLHDVEIRRWFVDTPLPSAVSCRHVCLDGNGRELYAEESAYVSDILLHESPESNDETSEENLQEIVRNVLSELVISESGGLLYVTLNSPRPLNLTLDVFTDNGISCLHEEFVADGIQTLTLSYGDIPSGRRLTVISGYGLSDRRYVRFH